MNLQQEKDSGTSLSAYCDDPACMHGAELPWDILIGIFGPEAEVTARDINARLRCTRCGSARKRGCSIRYSPNRTLGLGPTTPGLSGRAR